MLIAVVLQSIAGTINGSLSGPFVPRTGKWTPLPNGGFEGRIGMITNSSGYTGSGNFILVVPEGASSSASVASFAAAVGRYGARVRPGNTGGKSIALGYDGLVPVIPGRDYVVSAFVKRMHPESSRAEVHLDIWEGPLMTRTSTNTSEWQFIYAGFKASGHSASARVVFSGMVATNDEMCIDDLSITPGEEFLPPQPALNVTHLRSGSKGLLIGPFVQGSGRWNTVRGGDFEGGPRDIPYSAAWTGGDEMVFIVTDGTSGTARISTNAAQFGRYGAEIHPGRFSGPGITATYNGVYSLKPGRVYVLSGFIKRLRPENSRADIVFDLWLRTNDLYVFSTNSTKEWQFVYGAFTASNDPVSARAAIGQDVTEDDVAYFDELAITPVEDFVPPTVVSEFKPAVVEAQTSDGYLASIVVKDGGSGYTIPPMVHIEGVGRDATAIAFVENGGVKRIQVADPGVGFTEVPKIRLDPWPTKNTVVSPRAQIAPEIQPGRRYVVRESDDLKIWSQVGEPFVATNRISLSEFDSAAVARYFQVIELPQ